MRGEYQGWGRGGLFPLELPPRARRIRYSSGYTAAVGGTTSACAENTRHDTRRPDPAGNYLRVRGEYRFGFWGWGLSLELPPRARRIRCRGWGLVYRLGTTSACAENTFERGFECCEGGNYLRVRGEYSWASAGFTPNPELPPRARRIRAGAGVGDFLIGTTSACAENTGSRGRPPEPPGNYLRVRGEYRLGHGQSRHLGELPPRARRIHSHGDHFDEILGTTSACAENTAISSIAWRRSRNYLRVRGEYSATPELISRAAELPPRARRIRSSQQSSHHGLVNYLRVRGEYTTRLWDLPASVELPPRARRIRPVPRHTPLKLGTTSACAENTVAAFTRSRP